MCGIAGLMNWGDKSTLERMTAAITHRGPDSAGAEWFSHLHSGIGHRRLSIIDRSSAGAQPMPSANERFWITYNGEVYNYRELREELKQKGHPFRSDSDTEVVLRAFEEWGEGCLEKFNGMYAFAILDRQSGDLFAARDRIGVKPFYFAHRGDKLAFASEIKAILAARVVERAPDEAALLNPTRFQISPHTGFKGIEKLPPAHFLTFRAGKLSIKRYWQLGIEEEKTSLATAQAEVDELLRDSVKLQMISDVPVGLLLSGGLDSSLIGALMRKSAPASDIRSFTIKFPREDYSIEKVPDDSFYAARVAKDFGFSHHEVPVEPDVVDLLPKMIWHMDEPLADPSAINVFLICQAARELGTPVLLNGMGADEVFGGYRKQLACLWAEHYNHVPGPFRKLISGAIGRVPVAGAGGGRKSVRWAKRFLSFAELPLAERFLASDLSLNAAEFSELFAGAPDYHSTAFYRAQAERLQAGNGSYLARMCLNDTMVYLPEHNLSYTDKASMAMGVETRPPFTDHRLVERAFRLAPGLRIRRGEQKFLLKKIAESYLPREIIYRPKAPFGLPIRAWIKGALAPMINDLLCESAVKKRGLYRPEQVARLIREDREGLHDHSHLIWILLTTELWHQVFFDARPESSRLVKPEIFAEARSPR